MGATSGSGQSGRSTLIVSASAQGHGSDLPILPDISAHGLRTRLPRARRRDRHWPSPAAPVATSPARSLKPRGPVPTRTLGPPHHRKLPKVKKCPAAWVRAEARRENRGAPLRIGWSARRRGWNRPAPICTPASAVPKSFVGDQFISGSELVCDRSLVVVSIEPIKHCDGDDAELIASIGLPLAGSPTLLVLLVKLHHRPPLDADLERLANGCRATAWQ